MVGRFIAQDATSGKPTRPVTLNKYLYANADPINANDPSGRTTNFAEIEVAEAGGGYIGQASLTAGRSAVLQANRSAGKAFEGVIENLVRRILAGVPGATVRTQRALTGPGGKRIYDILIKVKDRLVIIETKTNIPAGGSSLGRLIGQIKTFSTAAEAEAVGAEVIVVSQGGWEAAALERIAQKLGTEAFASTFATEIELIELLPVLLGL